MKLHFSLYPLGMKLQFYLRLQDVLQQKRMASKWCVEDITLGICVDVGITSKR